jgi:ElaA protein
MITSKILPFNDLNPKELHDAMALRCAVFIVEQQCIYPDLDYRDEGSLHVLMHENNELIACARILPYSDGKSMSFGRLCTATKYRGQGLGKKMMDLISDYLQVHYPTKGVVITAQHHLQAFYQQYRFEPQGEPFDMDGIPHILMERQP